MNTLSKSLKTVNRQKKSIYTIAALFISMLCLSRNSFSQQPIAPAFSISATYFTTKKMKIWDSITKKYLTDKFKQASVFIENSNNNSIATVTVDIPDYYFIKDASVESYSYKKEIDGSVLYSLIALLDKKLVTVSIFYSSELSDSPTQISIGFSENTSNKNGSSRKIYVLYEFE